MPQVSPRSRALALLCVYASLSYRCIAHSPSTPTVKVAHFIDDTLGDDFTGLKPQYSPSDGWLSQQVCDQSGSCTSSPSFVDPSQVSNGTWHQAMPGPDTDERVVSVSFTGVSVTVFVVLLPAPTPAITEETEVGFIIDPSPSSTVNWVYDIAKLQGAAPIYNHQLWSAPLANGSHTLQVKTSGATNSLFLLDSIQYISSERASSSSTPSASSPLLSIIPFASGSPEVSTSSRSTPTSSRTNPPSITSSGSHPSPPLHSLNSAALVGGTIGGVLLVAVGVGAFLRLRMKRRSHLEKWRTKPLSQVETGIFAVQSPNSSPNEKQHTFAEQGHFPDTTQFNEDDIPALAYPRSIVSHPARPSLFTLAHSPVNSTRWQRASDEFPALPLEESLNSRGRDAYSGRVQPDIELKSDIDSVRAQRGSSVPTHASPTAPRATPLNQATSQSRKHSETSTHPSSTPHATPFTCQDSTSPAFRLTRLGQGPPHAPSSASGSREQLLQFTLPWSLGQRVLAMMAGGMSPRQGDEATDSGGDSDPPPAYEARST